MERMQSLVFVFAVVGCAFNPWTTGRVQSGGIVCRRKPCKLEDKICIEDKTLTIGWEFISIPSYPYVLEEPLTLVMVRTRGYVFYPQLFLTLEQGNEDLYFDTAIHEATGSLRLIRPIRGPREFNLRMVLENYSQTQHLLISRHVTNVYVHVSAFEF